MVVETTAACLQRQKTAKESILSGTKNPYGDATRPALPPMHPTTIGTQRSALRIHFQRPLLLPDFEYGRDLERTGWYLLEMTPTTSLRGNKCRPSASDFTAVTAASVCLKDGFTLRPTVAAVGGDRRRWIRMGNSVASAGSTAVKGAGTMVVRSAHEEATTEDVASHASRGTFLMSSYPRPAILWWHNQRKRALTGIGTLTIQQK